MKHLNFENHTIRNVGFALFFLFAAWPLTEIVSMGADDPKFNFKEMEHEGCQYLVVNQMANWGRAFGITHKGNCKNPIHVQKD